MKVPCKDIPFYDLNKSEWSTISFNNQKEFADKLLKDCFKEPGEYDFHRDFTVDGGWVEIANKFTKSGVYTEYFENTKEYKEFWKNEEIKSRKGVFWKYKDRLYYTTRDYYFAINYFRLVNKEKNYEETFPTVRDIQYHCMLYEKISELLHLNSAELKRRQMAWSNFHVAKSINYLWFENNKRIKWTAYDDKWITGTDGSWYMLDIAKKHLNLNTGWYRGFSPDKPGEIQQRVQIKQKDNWHWVGNESLITTSTTRRDPAAPVGGPTYWLWYEEGGIAPTADSTWQFIEPAIFSGGTRVGSICIGGSVGDLEQCKPLKEMILNPARYGVLPIPTKFYDETGIIKYCGLFLPAQYGMPEATDEHGNSLVDLALEILDKSEKIGWKAGEYKGNILVSIDEPAWIELPENDLILKKSQQPKNIKEAFANRNANEFNPARAQKRQEQIKILDERKERFHKQGLFIKTTEGKVKLKELSEFKNDKPIEMEWPVDPKTKDKRGVVNLYEEYNSKFEYFAGVDSTEVDITTTSESLFSISIYRRAYTEYDKTTGKTRMVKGKVICNWSGRFDSSDETFEHALFILEYFKAKAACERNKPGFINHVRRNGKSYLLAKRNELPFDKDIDVTASENDQYGVFRDSSGKLLRDLISRYKEHLNAELSVIYIDKSDSEDIGKIKKIIRGYDEVEDYWTLEEIRYYNKDDNFDRIDADMLAIAYGIAEELSFQKKVEIESKKKEEDNYYKKQPINKKKTNLLYYSSSSKGRNLLNY